MHFILVADEYCINTSNKLKNISNPKTKNNTGNKSIAFHTKLRISKSLLRTAVIF